MVKLVSFHHPVTIQMASPLGYAYCHNYHFCASIASFLFFEWVNFGTIDHGLVSFLTSHSFCCCWPCLNSFARELVSFLVLFLV